MVRNISKQILYFVVSLCVAFATLMILTPDVYITGMSTLLRENDKIITGSIFTLIIYMMINFWASKIKTNGISSKRDSNLELCRVLCMLMLIAHHIIVHGGILSTEGLTYNKYISILFIPIGKIAFDCFIALSCWFLVDQKFKMERFLRIWLEVLFYSVIFTIIASLLGAELTWRNWFSVFLPISGNSHGFAASYLAFYLLTPFLNRMTKNLTKIQARILLVLLFYFEVGTQIIGYFAQYTQPMASELFVFILIYVLILNLKKWPLNFTNKKYFNFGIFCMVYFLILIGWYYNLTIPGGNQFSHFILQVMCDESSITNILAGVALFFFFKNLKIKPLPLINELAKGTLGILLIHDHNFFRYYYWPIIVKTQQWYDSNKFIILIVLFVLWTFIVGTFIDCLRRNVEKIIFKKSKICSVSQKYDSKINEYV